MRITEEIQGKKTNTAGVEGAVADAAGCYAAASVCYYLLLLAGVYGCS
jgi:hypothetical protein